VDKLAKAILLFRNARRYIGASPVVLNRLIRHNLPAHQRSFAPEWQRAAEVLEQRMHRALALTTTRYNASPYHLAAFPLCAHVLVQHHATKRWDTPVVVVEVGDNRDYIFKTASGRLYCQYHRLLRHCVVVMLGTAVLTKVPAQISPPPALEPRKRR
jgi:hypothetical protein